MLPYHNIGEVDNSYLAREIALCTRRITYNEGYLIGCSSALKHRFYTIWSKESHCTNLAELAWLGWQWEHVFGSISVGKFLFFLVIIGIHCMNIVWYFQKILSLQKERQTQSKWSVTNALARKNTLMHILAYFKGAYRKKKQQSISMFVILKKKTSKRVKPLFKWQKRIKYIVLIFSALIFIIISKLINYQQILH